MKTKDISKNNQYKNNYFTLNRDEISYDYCHGRTIHSMYGYIVIDGKRENLTECPLHSLDEIIDISKAIDLVQQKYKLKEERKCESYKDGQKLYGPKRYVYSCDTRYYF
jgi:hypothetical protein